MKRLNRLSRARPGQARPHLPRAGDPPAAAVEREFTPGQMGARGDAVFEAETGPIYVPYGLPGERVKARIVGDRAESIEVLAASADRQTPACQHFGRCGGCQLQHWREAAYLAWKRDQVVQALARRGLGGIEVSDIVPAWGAGRRRAALHAARVRGKVQLGFIERGGARLTPIVQCPVLVPELEAVVMKLAPLAELTLPQRGEITLQCLLTDAGVDVAIKGAGRAEAVQRAAFEKLNAAARDLKLARLSVDGEPIVTLATPSLRMGLARVTPPPGAFLQATAEGEAVLGRLVLEALAGAGRVIDLFSGIGTFALRVAEKAEVLAAESDAEMLAALKAAADGAGGALKQVTTLRRDLLRTPLASLEMKKFDGAVIDPPRSGARLQAEQIARAPVRKLAYVSCEPASFARDVKVLIEHGFTITKLVPVDQFRWSPHIELVAAMER
ncbi:class I SAM-dependent RNA methyltransferase [Terricaulis sp.]|uniref:class I SAM-dependent RNA methyltransferase n=1 Tax=Terricaulis sp. TaxID=2768686 RepID=UPI00378360D1